MRYVGGVIASVYCMSLSNVACRVGTHQQFMNCTALLCLACCKLVEPTIQRNSGGQMYASIVSSKSCVPLLSQIAFRTWISQ